MTLLLSLFLSLFPIQDTEVFYCEVASLGEYGFSQISNHDEYVCKNPNDKTDFIILVDEHNNISINDNMQVLLNKYNEVVYYKIYE